MRKIFIAFILLLNTFLVFAQKKMNILFMIVDDFGSRDLACTGSTFYETPNFDKLANEGVRFTNAYTAHPRCVPSRYGMMTGRFPAREKIPAKKEIVHFEDKYPTIGEAMKEGGFKTFYIGKWHLGHTESEYPQNQGFDINLGGCSAGAPVSYFAPFNEKKSGGDPNHEAKDPIIGFDDAQTGVYITDYITDKTVKFIEENKNNTFFATVAHYAVHTPLEAKPELIKKYQDKLKKMSFEGEEFTFGVDGRQKMHQNDPVYAAMIESVDIGLGKIIQALKDNGIYENTIIVITSDHGGLSNSGTNSTRPLATTNLPLRAGKGHLYDGGLKVPLIVRVPNMTKKGTINESMITGTDYYPTFLELSGLALKPDAHADGVSFVEALKGKTINTDRDFFWHSPLGRPNQTGDRNATAYRKGDYKLLHYLQTENYELYNLKNDPYEKTNLASVEAGKFKEMKLGLEKWHTDIDAYMPLSANEYEKTKQEQKNKNKNKNKANKTN